MNQETEITNLAEKLSAFSAIEEYFPSGIGFSCHDPHDKLPTGMIISDLLDDFNVEYSNTAD